MEEHTWAALFKHPLQNDSDFSDSFANVVEGSDHSGGIVDIDGVDCVEHYREELRSCCFNGSRDHEEPFLVLCAREGGVYAEIVGIGEVGLVVVGCEVPKTKGGICSACWEL